MGSPNFTNRTDMPKLEEIEKVTFATFADMDASPTKAWIVNQFDNAQYKWNYDYAFAKRPAEELYDLAKDHDQMKNVAADPAYAEITKRLKSQLMDTLVKAEDPRVTGDGSTFDKPPFTVQAR